MSQNLLKRLITSIVLLSLLIFIIFSHKYIFILSVLIIGLIICLEANNLFSKFLTNKYSKQNSLINRLNIKFIMLNIITFFYIFFVFCNLSYEIYKTESSFFFLYVISICFFTDIGGYVFGNIFKGPKLTKISPSKTYSGVIGSFLFSLIIGIIFVKYLENNLLDDDLTKITISILMISLISQLGDLIISFFKRKAKLKDTGKILPGHGGLLDRIDGIIFVMPLVNLGIFIL